MKSGLIYFRNTIIIIAIIISSLATINAILTYVEKENNPAPGKLINVNNKKMHLLTIGSGEKNVILLGGLGTPSTVLDFENLAKELSNDFSVTTIEYLGYGWSDNTDTPRTNPNIINETRSALMATGINPPYNIVAHSISGIYSLFWANEYPQEINSITGIDQTIPQLGEYFTDNSSNNLMEILRLIGITRIMYLMDPNITQSVHSEFSSITNTKIVMIQNWIVNNKSIRDEFDKSKQNCMELIGTLIPKNIPTLQILASNTIKNIPIDFPGIDWIREHEKLTKNNMLSKTVVIEGDHYLHWNNYKQIATMIKEFTFSIE